MKKFKGKILRTTVPFFDLLIRKNGEILIILPTFTGTPYHTPIFSFNKTRDLGVLFRDEAKEIALTHFPKDALDEIAEAEFITFIELDSKSQIASTYRSSVVPDEKLK